MKLERSVFGGLPSRAANGFSLITEFGINFFDSINVAILKARSAFHHNRSDCIIGIRRIIV